MKRFLDIVLSSIALIVLSPLFFIISIIILIESNGGVFFRQTRVGKDNHDFSLLKFRSMKQNADQQGFLTVGANDLRITRFGNFLRKYKLDEFPQLINIIKGDMSIVGPRPEVRKFVNLYQNEQLNVLSVRPGLTDYASLHYINESELLATSENPEELYINEIMPHKIELNLQYIQNQSIKEDFTIIFKTLRSIGRQESSVPISKSL